jgi:hypothetical protein
MWSVPSVTPFTALLSRCEMKYEETAKISDVNI